MMREGGMGITYDARGGNGFSRKYTTLLTTDTTVPLYLGQRYASLLSGSARKKEGEGANRWNWR